MPQCPQCKTTDDSVYIGLNNVECPNQHCPSYNDKLVSKEDKVKKDVEDYYGMGVF
jgi:hypothetical protein